MIIVSRHLYQFNCTARTTQVPPAGPILYNINLIVINTDAVIHFSSVSLVKIKYSHDNLADFPLDFHQKAC